MAAYGKSVQLRNNRARSRIMIVESDPTAREDLARIIRASAHTLTAEAEGPEDAVDIFSRTSPGIVITRLVFPSPIKKVRIGGVDLMKRIKEIDEHVRVIVSFARDTSYLVMDAIYNGASGRISRPYRYDLVVREVTSVASSTAFSDSGTGQLAKTLAVAYRPSRRFLGGRRRLAVSTNVSLDEINLRTEEEVLEGAVLDLNITLPRLKDPIVGRAKVNKVKVLVPGQSYELRCSLSRISEGDKRKLDIFLVWGGGWQ